MTQLNRKGTNYKVEVRQCARGDFRSEGRIILQMTTAIGTTTNVALLPSEVEELVVLLQYHSLEAQQNARTDED